MRWGFLGGAVIKICLPVQEIWVQSPGGKISWNTKWLHIPVFLSGKFLGQRSLVRYSPWDHRVGHNWVTEHAYTKHGMQIIQQPEITLCLVYLKGESFMSTCLLFCHQNSLYNLFDYLSWIIPLLKHKNVAVKLFQLLIMSLSSIDTNFPRHLDVPHWLETQEGRFLLRNLRKKEFIHFISFSESSRKYGLSFHDFLDVP